MVNGEHDQFQACVTLDHIDDFANIGWHVDSGVWADDCGEQGEIEVGAIPVANDVCKESAAESVAIKEQRPEISNSTV